MKPSLYFLFTLVILTSCTKNEDTIPEEPMLNITSSEWYLERINDTGGSVHLIIVGSTNGDKVTVRTFGDGLISDRTIELDSQKHFANHGTRFYCVLVKSRYKDYKWTKISHGS